MPNKNMHPNIKSRLIDVTDKEWIVELYSDLRITEFLPTKIVSRERSHAFFEKYLEICKMGEPYEVRIYFDDETKERMGIAACRPFEREPDYPGNEVGVIIVPEFWNQGVATFIANDLKSRIESKIGSNPSVPFYALVHDENIVSQKINRRFGFTLLTPSKKNPNASIWKFTR